MSSIRQDCPRCGTKKIAFDVDAVHELNEFSVELFCVCKHCNESTIFYALVDISQGLRIKDIKTAYQNGRHLNDYLFEMEVVYLKPQCIVDAPEHLPHNVNEVFEEGAISFANNCFNASAAMFRSCLEMSLKDKFSEELKSSEKKLFTLYQKIEYLKNAELLGSGLFELADCIREDGNDAVHQCTADKGMAEDLQDFCIAALRVLYTEPEQLRLAKVRREARRKTKP